MVWAEEQGGKSYIRDELHIQERNIPFCLPSHQKDTEGKLDSSGYTL